MPSSFRSFRYDQPDGNVDAVGRLGLRDLDLVTRRVEAAEHRYLLQELPLAGGRVVVVDRRGRDGGLVGEADHAGVELAVVRQVHLVRGLGEGDAMGLAAPEVGDADLRPAAFALDEHVEILEEQVAGQHDVVAMRHDLLPARLRGVADRRRDQPVVASRVVGPDPERPVAVVDVVLVLRRALRDHLPAAAGPHPRACSGSRWS